MKYVDPDQLGDEELTLEEAAALDRELFEIRDSDRKGKPENKIVWVGDIILESLVSVISIKLIKLIHL